MKEPNGSFYYIGKEKPLKPVGEGLKRAKRREIS